MGDYSSGRYDKDQDRCVQQEPCNLETRNNHNGPISYPKQNASMLIKHIEYHNTYPRKQKGYILVPC